VVNEAYISADFYFDVGKETCPRKTYLSTEDVGDSLPIEILLWKKYCLVRKTWQHIRASLSSNSIVLIKAYLYVKARCYYWTQGSIQESFGV
jgi:hypothetical protein